MKKPTQTQSKKLTGKVSVKKNENTQTAKLKSVSRQGSISRITRITKSYGKRTLRDLLLSKTFHSTFKIIVGLMVFGSALYGVYAFIGNTFANNIVVSKSEILVRVAKHTELPASDPDAVVRVQDAEILKKQNDFYTNVKEGDYIVMYANLAIIYDLRNDSIVALKRTDK